MIDAHIHAWDPQLSPDILTFAKFRALRRRFEPKDLTEDFLSHRVECGVLIQSEPTEAHSNCCAAIARDSDLVAASSGWLDPTGEYSDSQMTRFARDHCGFRIMMNRMSDQELNAGSLDRLCDVGGHHDLTVDLLGLANHQYVIERLLKAAPSTRFVLNHSAQPDTAAPIDLEWVKTMKRLGHYPNLYNKVSGLIEKSRGNVASVFDHLDVVFDSFEAGRLMFASNWPIVGIFGGYGLWVDTLNQFLDSRNIDAAARRSLVKTAAETAYGLVVS